MTMIRIETIEPKKLVEGAESRFIHSEKMTMAYWRFQEGTVIPEHAHPHEQITTVVEGAFKLVIGGVEHHLDTGCAVIIPADVPHSGIALADSYLIDVFHPVREDYR